MIRQVSAGGSLRALDDLSSQTRTNHVMGVTYRLDPSLQDGIEQKFTSSCLKQPAVVLLREGDARVVLKLRNVGREIHFSPVSIGRKGCAEVRDG